MLALDLARVNRILWAECLALCSQCREGRSGRPDACAKCLPQRRAAEHVEGTSGIWELRAGAVRGGQAAAVEKVEAERVRILAARAPQLLPQEEPQDGASDGEIDAGTHRHPSPPLHHTQHPFLHRDRRKCHYAVVLLPPVTAAVHVRGVDRCQNPMRHQPGTHGG